MLNQIGAFLNMIRKISQSRKEVLDKGLEMALFKYNEELKKSESYNSRAMYPISIISFMLTFSSFFIKDKQLFTINTFNFLIALVILVLFVILCLLFVEITKPIKIIEKKTCPEPTYYYEMLNNATSKSDFVNYLITIYTEDHNIIFGINNRKGKYLKYMNFLLSIIIILFIIILYSQYFNDLVLLFSK